MDTPWLWIGFVGFLLAFLALDLGVFNRRAHAVQLREAAGWSLFWIAVSLAFNAGIYWKFGSQAALQFLTAYLLEYSLSADNVLLFGVIFAAFAVAAEYQHRVLYRGVLLALVIRGGFIIAGVQLVNHFHWILYAAAVFLLVMGVRLLRQREGKYDPSGSTLLRFVRRILPISEHAAGGRFFTRVDGRLFGTPLLLVLIMIEVVDVTFALDSIPAAFAVTHDAFIIFTSNILAVLGLRSLYFLLAPAMSQFRYLRDGIAVILMFMGASMLSERWFHVPTGFELLGILSILVISIIMSLVTDPRRRVR